MVINKTMETEQEKFKENLIELRELVYKALYIPQMVEWLTKFLNNILKK